MLKPSIESAFGFHVKQIMNGQFNEMSKQTVWSVLFCLVSGHVIQINKWNFLYSITRQKSQSSLSTCTFKKIKNKLFNKVINVTLIR